MKRIKEEQEFGDTTQKLHANYMVNEERKGFMTNQNWFSKSSKDIVSVTDWVENDSAVKSH